MKVIPKKGKANCPQCDTVINVTSLTRHQKKMHGAIVKYEGDGVSSRIKIAASSFEGTHRKPGRMKCGICEELLEGQLALCDHVAVDHQHTIRVKMAKFGSWDDFYGWLKLLENGQYADEDGDSIPPARFIIRSSQKDAKSGELKQRLYKCHRSGEVKTLDLERRLRAPSIKGSVRANFNCTAFALAKVSNEDGTLHVRYCLDHYKHDFQRLQFSQTSDTRKKLANFLKAEKGQGGGEFLEELPVPGPETAEQVERYLEISRVQARSRKRNVHTLHRKMMELHKHGMLDVYQYNPDQGVWHVRVAFSDNFESDNETIFTLERAETRCSEGLACPRLCHYCRSCPHIYNCDCGQLQDCIHRHLVLRLERGLDSDQVDPAESLDVGSFVDIRPEKVDPKLPEDYRHLYTTGSSSQVEQEPELSFTNNNNNRDLVVDSNIATEQFIVEEHDSSITGEEIQDTQQYLANLTQDTYEKITQIDFARMPWDRSERIGYLLESLNKVVSKAASDWSLQQMADHDQIREGV